MKLKGKMKKAAARESIIKRALLRMSPIKDRKGGAK